ncbi:Solute carrier family 22 member 18, partial [Lonchura striata]
MKFPGVMEVFIVKVFAGLPLGLFMIMFSIISMDFFGLEAVESGYLMSYFGVLQMGLVCSDGKDFGNATPMAIRPGMLLMLYPNDSRLNGAYVFLCQVVQGLLVEKLASHCSEMTLLRLSIFVFASVGLGMALMRTVWHYCIIAVPMVFAFNTLATITDSMLTKAVPSSSTGKTHQK